MFGLSYKHNNRRYVSEGVQTNLDWDWGEHTFALGARYHEDEVDRFQPTELMTKSMVSLLPVSVAEPNVPSFISSIDSYSDSGALSFWATDAWQISDALRLDLALRHERVKSEETRFDDVGRRNNAASTRDNDLSIWLPGIAAFYECQRYLVTTRGFYHRGFSPLGGSASSGRSPKPASTTFGARLTVDVFCLRGDWFLQRPFFEPRRESCSSQMLTRAPTARPANHLYHR